MTAPTPPHRPLPQHAGNVICIIVVAVDVIFMVVDVVVIVVVILSSLASVVGINVVVVVVFITLASSSFVICATIAFAAGCRHCHIILHEVDCCLVPQFF